MDKELTTHQRGVILRGICNGAALRDNLREQYRHHVQCPAVHLGSLLD